MIFIVKDEFAECDYHLNSINPSMFLIMMSVLNKSHSLQLSISPLMVISKEYYELLNFDESKVKYLSIKWNQLIYPINKFENNRWWFDKSLENYKKIEEISLSAYALFKFLVWMNILLRII